MHDSLLMQNISGSLNEICRDNGIRKITKLDIAVNRKSPINERNLLEHLLDMNKGLIDNSTIANVLLEDIPDEVAEIRKVEGEK